uniref:CoA-binding domain-containing protein n=1 Tax=Arsenophonus endosymbiont of Trialeurodes vaporariorum TaxID=235567 RepID=A0A3B0MHQ6_9GAMM
MDDQKLTDILTKVKFIALVGASDIADRPSYKVIKYLINQGYNVTPVSPKLAGKELLGQKVYAHLVDIPYPIDMVDVFRNSAAAFEVAEQAIAINAKVIWLQLGILNQEAKKMAERAGLAVVMNACPKIEIPRLGLEK